jgi:hypothetical protein
LRRENVEPWLFEMWIRNLSEMPDLASYAGLTRGPRARSGRGGCIRTNALDIVSLRFGKIDDGAMQYS